MKPSCLLCCFGWLDEPNNMIIYSLWFLNWNNCVLLLRWRTTDSSLVQNSYSASVLFADVLFGSDFLVFTIKYTKLCTWQPTHYFYLFLFFLPLMHLQQRVDSGLTMHLPSSRCSRPDFSPLLLFHSVLNSCVIFPWSCQCLWLRLSVSDCETPNIEASGQ